MYDISTRLYYLLLRLYPASFRHVYEDLMVQAFRDSLRDARRDGMIAISKYWLHALFDLIVNALREHMAVARAGSLKYRTLRGASLTMLFLSYLLLWYAVLAMLVFYAEPTGGSPAGTVQYYVARLARIRVLAYGVPTIIVGISLLTAGRIVIQSPRIAPLWSLVFINILATPMTILLFFPVRALVHGLGLLDRETYGNLLYYPPAAFLIWIPVMLAQVAVLLWLHHRIAQWTLRSN